MRQLLLCIAVMLVVGTLVPAAPCAAQQSAAQLARRGVGLRIGTWKVPAPVAASTEFTISPHVELFFQRGLGEHVSLESSVAAWRRISTKATALPGSEIVTRSYIIPIFTALKFFPVTTVNDAIEPYFLGGAGFALGIQNEGSNAIGGGGTSISTGFGVKAEAGLEYHVTRSLGLLAGGRYQLIRFGDPISEDKKFRGGGFEGGLSYRLQF